ncbi:MAG: xylulokinase [Beutenbergiaceae bacterium]
MSAGLSLGIDLGTSSVKALLLDDHGRTAAVASSHHGIDTSVAGVQVDARVWWDSMLTALTQLARQHPLADVHAVGFSGNMSAVVLVDAEFDPVAPTLLLPDLRGREELLALDPVLVERITSATGNIPATVFALSSLLWWQAHDPAVLRRARWYLSAKDFLRARLTGAASTDPTDAGNSLLLNAASSDWDHDRVTHLGLPSRILPPVLSSHAESGRLTEAAAGLTGLPAGIPVATGAGDIAASLAGMGGLPADAVALSLGTSATLMAGLESGRLPVRLRGALTEHVGTDGARYAMGSLLTGGMALNWLRHLTGPEALQAARDIPDAESPVQFLPYLTGTGSPDFDHQATGTILGITPSTTAAQLVTAALEAISFDVAALIDDLAAGGGRYHHIALSGGGTRVAAWPQILADVTGLPIRILVEPDLSAVGAARLGWQAAGRPAAGATSARAITPRAEHQPAWRRRRSRHQVARRAALALNHQLHPSENGTPGT